ncbi:unnamed protein product [Paramecium sonneborni]|uniref:Uncharacterized protein n=1 Tax=Paramecium sonneborni TaxID=65129 RepID=A0A8S1LV97_9CILI|nr:unnamed protein product [Paramecium sonneborni]
MQLKKILRLGISKGLNFELICFLPYGLLIGKDKRLAIAFWALLIFELRVQIQHWKDVFIGISMKFLRLLEKLKNQKKIKIDLLLVSEVVKTQRIQYNMFNMACPVKQLKMRTFNKQYEGKEKPLVQKYLSGVIMKLQTI